MKIELAVISAIVGTLLIGKGLWQYVYPQTHRQIQTVRQHQQQNVSQLTREQLERHNRTQQYLQEQRRRELKTRLRDDQERRLTQRLRQLHNSTSRR